MSKKAKKKIKREIERDFHFISSSLWDDKDGKGSVRQFTESGIYSKLVLWNVIFQFWKVAQSFREDAEEWIQLVGPLASCANIIVHKPHASLKKNQWHNILQGKGKNLPVQWAVIFTQGDSWTARSLLRRAPKTSGKEQMFSLLLMQNRWEWLFKTFLAGGGETGGPGGVGGSFVIEDWNTVPFLAPQSIKNICRVMPPWNINERSVRCARA